MQTINLKQYYPFCKEDIFVEVSDEIVEAFLLDKRAEAARERKMFRYKAFYSLDCNDGIENAAIGWAQPSPEDYLIEKEELAEYEELIRRLYEAISSLPPMQARRVHARYMLGMKVKDIPVMDYRQYRRVRRLVHECCNYIDGNCIALDDGEECVCVQSISYSLLCRWFRAAVLPQDKELETALFHRLNAKKCSVCGALFTPGSNRAKYCPECAARMKRINAAKRKRKQREKCHALGAEKPL